MDVNILKAFPLAQLKDGIKMGVVTVNASVREKSPQMKVASLLLTVVYGTKKFLILEKVTILDVFGYKGKVLVNDPSGSDVHMSYLGITHLSVGKSYRKARSVSLLKGALGH